VKNAADYLTSDPGGAIAQGDAVGQIVPDDGDVPFLIRIGGINQLSPQAMEIFTSNETAGRAVPYGYSYSSKSKSEEHCRRKMTDVHRSLDAFLLWWE